MIALLLLSGASDVSKSDDNMRYDQVLFAGTHNSGINLGHGTLGRPIQRPWDPIQWSEIWISQQPT